MFSKTKKASGKKRVLFYPFANISKVWPNGKSRWFPLLPQSVYGEFLADARSLMHTDRQLEKRWMF